MLEGKENQENYEDCDKERSCQPELHSKIFVSNVNT